VQKNCCSFGLYNGECPEPDVCGVVTPGFVTEPVTMSRSAEPTPEGVGGEIIAGSYVLQQLRYHEGAPGGCVLSETPALCTLMLGSSSGTVSIPDARYSASFDYRATEGQLALTPTCENGVLIEHPLWSFDSYTATEARLDLFDSTCGVTATFRRRGYPSSL